MPTFDLAFRPRRYTSRGVADGERAPLNPFAAAWILLAFWNERTHQRRMLGELDDHMLRDIGVTRAEAAREADKPFWK